MSHSRNTADVTDAEDSHERDISSRTHRYLISMGFRMVCFILAVIIPGPLRWVFVVGAVIIPWIAVLIANAAAPSTPRTNPAVSPGAAQLPEQPESPRQAEEPDVVIGEIIEPSRQLPSGPSDTSAASHGSQTHSNPGAPRDDE